MSVIDSNPTAPLTRTTRQVTPESQLERTDRDDQHLESFNARAYAIAWISILCGALSGMVMGLWSFEGPFSTPYWIGEYDDLPRRFLRLAHVAMFALGALHIMIVKWIASSAMKDPRKITAYVSMAAGNILMPTLLIGAAIWAPMKYLTVLPATALAVAFFIVALDAFRAARRD